MLALGPACKGDLTRHESEPAAAPSYEVTFGRSIARLSEDEGTFFSGNLVSNEPHYLDAAPWLLAHPSTERVYIGVGPEQNLSYIALLRPRLSFIVDVRRDNLLLHLIYKCLFERAKSRVEWLAALLGRDLEHARLTDADALEVSDPSTTLEQIVALVRASPPSATHSARTLDDVLSCMDRLGVDIEPHDAKRLGRLLTELSSAGLDARFETTSPRPDFPTLEQLLLAHDPSSRATGFLGSVDSYRTLRALHARDAIIPLVGDFAGQHTFEQIGESLRERGLELSVLYASNVEQYLLLDGRWAAWRDNVRTLPAAPSAFILRTYSDRRAPLPGQGERLWQVLRQPLAALPAQAPESYRALALQSERPSTPAPSQP